MTDTTETPPEPDGMAIVEPDNQTATEQPSDRTVPAQSRKRSAAVQPRKIPATSAMKAVPSASGGNDRSIPSGVGDQTTHVAGRAAAARVERAQHIAVTVPVLGEVKLPPPGHLAFYGGMMVLAAIELIEWPVAVALAAGHALASQHHNASIRELGEALEEA
jgi:hypothetical protein